MFEYEGILIPETVVSYDDANVGWCTELYKLVSKDKEMNTDLWKYIFETVFLDKRFTDNHKYAICIIFSAILTKYYMDIQYGEILTTYDEVVNLIGNTP